MIENRRYQGFEIRCDLFFLSSKRQKKVIMIVKIMKKKFNFNGDRREVETYTEFYERKIMARFGKYK